MKAIKTIEEIYRQMLADFGEKTGLEPREGADLSARMYALAAQVYALYVQADWVTRQAFPQTDRRGGLRLPPGYPPGDGVHDGGPGAL